MPIIKWNQCKYKQYVIDLLKEKTTLFDSKFGGIPYWDLSKEYPVDNASQSNVKLSTSVSDNDIIFT